MRHLTVIAGGSASMVICSVVWETVRVVEVMVVVCRQRFEESKVLDDAFQGACLPVRSRPG